MICTLLGEIERGERIGYAVLGNTDSDVTKSAVRVRHVYGHGFDLADPVDGTDEADVRLEDFKIGRKQDKRYDDKEDDRQISPEPGGENFHSIPFFTAMIEMAFRGISRPAPAEWVLKEEKFFKKKRVTMRLVNGL
jgi:hypothetical protein